MSPTHDEFVVAVVAPMSSGKTTILNAMLGKALLPSKNEACTAIPMKITDIDGLEEIRAQAIHLDGRVSGWVSLSDEDSCLSDWNTGTYTSIEIQGDFPNIDNHVKRMVFLDTPGPNNSTNMLHGELTHKILSENGFTFLMFVLNTTQFGVEDERRLLRMVADKLKIDGDHSSIVFLVNKIDALDLERDECPKTHVGRVKSYLVEMGFKTPIVIPVMGKLSLELRVCLAAHKAQIALPFSSRVQCRIAHEIDYVLAFKETYGMALKYVPSAGIDFSPSSLHQNTAANIRIGDRDFTLEEIIEAEIITGIPALERCLQASLASHGAHDPALVASIARFTKA
ncbi:MAG: hypothetical protein COB46_13615 [Rhodospirillaceae bacterium]|nr:dynamin family protein [Colwellia sp.]PCI37336.1 MAG: hypothetical protein COB46_13615 [Rhodospirillaceae bacterium]